MEKNKYPHTDPNDQVHSEYEHSIGNNFKVVRQETPIKEGDNEYDPLNQLPEFERNEFYEAPPKMNAVGAKVDKIPLLIGLLGVIGLIGVIGVVNSLRVNRLTS